MQGVVARDLPLRAKTYGPAGCQKGPKLQGGESRSGGANSREAPTQTDCTADVHPIWIPTIWGWAEAPVTGSSLLQVRREGRSTHRAWPSKASHPFCSPIGRTMVMDPGADPVPSCIRVQCPRYAPHPCSPSYRWRACSTPRAHWAPPTVLSGGPGTGPSSPRAAQ